MGVRGMHRPFSLFRRSTGIGAAVALVMLVGAAAAQADSIKADRRRAVLRRGRLTRRPAMHGAAADQLGRRRNLGRDDQPHDVRGVRHPHVCDASPAGQLCSGHDHADWRQLSPSTRQPGLASRRPSRRLRCSRSARPSAPTRMPVPDHGHQQRQHRPVRPQPGAVRECGGLADRRGQQLLQARYRTCPLSVPGSDLFNFEGDGICNPGVGPAAPGCVDPGGGTCGAGGTSVICSFPKPPGQPAGYTEPGAPTGQHPERLRGSDHLVFERKRYRHE